MTSEQILEYEKIILHREQWIKDLQQLVQKRDKEIEQLKESIKKFKMLNEPNVQVSDTTGDAQ